MKKIITILIIPMVAILVSWSYQPYEAEKDSEILEYYKPSIENNTEEYYTRLDINNLFENGDIEATTYNIPKHIIEPIITHSLEYNVPINISVGVAFVESTFNPRATNRNRNGSSDYGLFQLNDSYRNWSNREFFDINKNTEEGISYLSEMMDYFNGDVLQALAAYNAGPYRVENNLVPESTKMYVLKVLEAEDSFNIIVNNSIYLNRSLDG